MADLRNVSVVIRDVGLWRFLKKIWFEVGDDNLFTWAAALAYSWLFALFPFFLVLLSLIPLLRPEWKQEAKDQIDMGMRQLPHEAQVTLKQYVEPRIKNLLYEPPKALNGIWSIGLLLTIWAASGGTAMTMAAMDRCYDVERVRPFYKQRPLAIMLTLIVVTLMLVVAILVPIGTMVTHYLTTRTETLLEFTGIGQPAGVNTAATMASTLPASQPVSPQAVAEGSKLFPLWIALWQIARYGLATLFLFWVVGLIYHFGPNVKKKFRLLTPGSVFTVAMWAILAVTFRVYIDTFGKYGQTYGAVGGVIILLLLFYVDALILLVGAEINSEIDCAMRLAAGEREKPPPPREIIDTKPAKEAP